MTYSTRACLLLAGLFGGCVQPRPQTPPARQQLAVLVFYKTQGFHHASIPAGIAALQQLGRENNLRVDTTKQATRFVPDSLRRYAAVVFLNTTGDVLNASQQVAFEQYIGQGHGFMGVHAATDTEYDWPWYRGLVGAAFQSHPAVQPATIRITDANHQAAPGLRVLATLDEASYQGGTNGSPHPFIWCHPYGGGRAFYTGGGHSDASYAEPLFRRHLLGGLQYALGL